MEKIFLNENETQLAKDYQNSLDELYRELGRLRVIINLQKQEEKKYLEQIDQIHEKYKPMREMFIQKYGAGNINTDTGEYTKI